jgi:hypothetical protein
MTYKSNGKASKNPFKSPQLLSQKELIGKINSHTCFTRRFVELLATQIDQMNNKYKKEKENDR